MTTETEYTDDDVLRAHNAEVIPPPTPTGYSKSTMTMFRNVKKASALNDARSRRIVASLNKERAEKSGYKPITTHTTHSQSNIMEF